MVYVILSNELEMIYVDVEILAQEFEIGEGEDGEDEDGENANEDGHEVLIVTY